MASSRFFAYLTGLLFVAPLWAVEPASPDAGYVTGAARWGDEVVGAEFLGERHYRRAGSIYASAGVLVDRERDDRFFGLGLGLRGGLPGRVFPFVGVGAYFGLSQAGAEFVTADGQVRSRVGVVFEGVALYPEFGFRLTLSPEFRLVGTARYYTDMDDEQVSFWLYGLGIGYLWD